VSVDREVVQHVAALARLRLTPETESTFTRQLADIVGYVDVLNRLPGTEDATRAGGAPLRGDAVMNQDRSATLLAAAPDRDGDRIRVPAVLGDGE
jgi:aspartyl-tRNA(Asn)/glutamyl-tRNA(Gln) amidotransferase subunit C